MSTLSITKSYSDGTVLFESDLDAIRTSVETFLNTTKINDDNIQNDGITASSKLVDASITEAKMGAGAITTSKLGDGAVTADKLAAAVAGNGLAGGAGTALSVTVDDSTLEINSDTVRVKDSGITTAKLNDGAVTQAKRASLGQQVSSSSGSFSTSSSSFVDVTNLSVSITTTGRPVFLALVNDGSGSPSNVGSFDLTTGSSTVSQTQAELIFVRDSSEISRIAYQGAATGFGAVTPSSEGGSLGSLPFHIDIPSADTYTYKVQLRALENNAFCSRVKLVAFEL